MTKILDTFLFTHEFDLLELRLRLLWPVVDKFLLMEGDHNFTNQPKKMRFSEQAERFAWAKEKLIHIQHIGKFADREGQLSIPGELFVEHQHRQYLYDRSKHIGYEHGFTASDILLISDVDEIPSREVIAKLKAEDFPSPSLFDQDFYYYNINCHRGRRWHGTMAMRLGYSLSAFKHDIGAARQARLTMPKIEYNCGWHFAHFYDAESIKEKLQHSSHQGYYTEEIYNPEHLKKCVAENKNYLGKKDGSLPKEPLPEYALAELKRFPIMMGEEWR